MAAPSFSSFPELEPGPSTRHDGERDRARAKHQDKDEDRHKRKKHSSHDRSRHKDSSARDNDRKRDKDRPRERERDSGRDSKRDSERRRDTREPSAAFSSVYVSDRRGDPFNVTYGGLHAASVPRYYRSRSKSADECVKDRPFDISTRDRSRHAVCFQDR